MQRECVFVSWKWSHSLSKKHPSQTTLKCITDIRNCFAPGEASTSIISTSSLSSVLQTTFSGDIFWALEVVKFNFSGQSSDNKFQLFQMMFSDCIIAKSSSMQRKKIAFLIIVVLVPFFFWINWEKLKISIFTNYFDESLNEHLEKIQMNFL